VPFCEAAAKGHFPGRDEEQLRGGGDDAAARGAARTGIAVVINT
jgi:hypothetical protein